MSRKLVKSGVATAFVLVLLVAGFGTTAYASPSSGQPHSVTPYVPVCTQFTYTDKPSGGRSVSASGYTMTVYVEFMYDAHTHELCLARSKVTMNDGNNNLVGGTIYLHFSNCSSIVDSHNIAFPGGTGSHTYYGNVEGASCGATTANFQASNGVWVPGPGSSTFDDTGNQNG